MWYVLVETFYIIKMYNLSIAKNEGLNNTYRKIKLKIMR